MTARRPVLPVIEPEIRAAPETMRRLESVERTLKLVTDGLEDIKASVRALRERDGDLDDRFQKFAAEQRKGNEALAEALKAQQGTFTDALAKEAAARKVQAEEFTTALSNQAQATIETIKSIVFKSIADRVWNWLLTIGGSVALLWASYYWTKMK